MAQSLAPSVNCCGVNVSRGATEMIPALLTRASTLPHRCVSVSASASTASGSAMSQV